MLEVKRQGRGSGDRDFEVFMEGDKGVSVANGSCLSAVDDLCLWPAFTKL